MSKEPLVIFMPSGRRERVAEGTPLLAAAREMGVEIESICGGKLTCGKCMVNVQGGAFAKLGIVSAENHLSPPSETECDLIARKGGGADARLACVACVQDDVLLFVPEASRARRQVIRKAATDR
ncbi:MAG TPA: 2Fe-2S iron-sulfur cluster binding domain-containing protein, partial [Anaerolineae bacterium]|nr:2Fe-2S iron-sulfur cluster binding domain-containing protein [Anaerolineae bacterium]